MEVELRLGDVNIVPQAYSDGIWYFIAKYKDKSIRFSIGEGILEPNKYSILGEQLGNVDNVLIFENGIIYLDRYLFVKVTNTDGYYMDIDREGLSAFTRFLDKHKYLIVFEILRNFGLIYLGIFEYIKDDVKQFLKNPCMFYFRLFYKFVEGL